MDQKVKPPKSPSSDKSDRRSDSSHKSLNRKESNKHLDAILSHYEKVYSTPQPANSPSTENHDTPKGTHSKQYITRDTIIASTTSLKKGTGDTGPKTREYLASTYDDLMYGSPNYTKPKATSRRKYYDGL
ncbi:hypothetical protein WA171_003345 [Blastocystis sp. BT1]